MDIQLVTWKIVGIKPLIQGNPHGMWKPPEEDDGELKKTERKKSLRNSDSEDFQAAKGQLYVNEDGAHYHPAIAFWQGLLMACDGRKLGAPSALSVVTQAVALIEEEFILYDPATLDGNKPQLLKGDEWQIDYRRAVNHNKEKSEGGVGVVAIRPKFKSWGGFLALEVDADFFTRGGVFNVEGLTALLNVAGHYYGVGVGRMRVKAMVKQKPVWSGFGAGKYSAALKE